MTTNTLYRAVHNAVLHDWDPIGVGNIPEAQDEYNAYVPIICELLTLRNSRSEIVNYLSLLATQQMGLTGNTQEIEAFADKLTQLAATIDEIEPHA